MAFTDEQVEQLQWGLKLIEWSGVETEQIRKSVEELRNKERKEILRDLYLKNLYISYVEFYIAEGFIPETFEYWYHNIYLPNTGDFSMMW